MAGAEAADAICPGFMDAVIHQLVATDAAFGSGNGERALRHIEALLGEPDAPIASALAAEF